MRIADADCTLVTKEPAILAELLPLDGAQVLELGCGKAEMTRAVAAQATNVLALEVDEIQLAKNQEIDDLPNVRFERGSAQEIPAADASADIVLMFKSLHHVPLESMDAAFAEIQRVLKPGGLLYVSEPVYAGAFNEVLRLFHDEKAVREAAFAAEQRALSSGRFALRQQKFFLNPMHFDGFPQFEEHVIKVTHTEHRLSPELLRQVKEKFEQHLTPAGVDFEMPIRVDLFEKR